jgi:hypothetical protein
VIVARNETRVSGFSIADGKQVWSMVVGGTGEGYVTEHNELVQPLFSDDWAISVIDVDTGRVKRSHSSGGASQVVRSVSTDSVVVLEPDPGATRFTYIDLATGMAATQDLPLGTTR